METLFNVVYAFLVVSGVSFLILFAIGVWAFLLALGYQIVKDWRVKCSK